MPKQKTAIVALFISCHSAMTSELGSILTEIIKILLSDMLYFNLSRRQLKFFQFFMPHFHASPLAFRLYVFSKKGGKYEHANEKNKRQ